MRSFPPYLEIEIDVARPALLCCRERVLQSLRRVLRMAVKVFHDIFISIRVRRYDAR
jgi:hypothetical protein